MNREIHVRLREGLRVRFPWATRPASRLSDARPFARRTAPHPHSKPVAGNAAAAASRMQKSLAAILIAIYLHHAST